MAAEPTERRLIAWLLSDDTGASSKAMAGAFAGLGPGDKSHPHDCDDLGRCVRLLDAIPEWRPRVPEMAAVSPYWAVLVPHWGELEQAWRDGQHSVALYRRMRSILRPAEDADARVVRLGEGVLIRMGGE